jgi:hypothetical protein
VLGICTVAIADAEIVDAQGEGSVSCSVSK